MNMVLCMLFGSGLPPGYWGYASKYAVYVLNCMPTRENEGRKSTLELLTKKPVGVADVVVFGSPCRIYTTPANASLGKIGTEAVIVVKNDETKGFKVLNLSEQVVITTRHVNHIETLTAESNLQLRQVLESEEEDELEALARERERERGWKEPTRDDASTARGSAMSKYKSKRATSTMQDEKEPAQNASSVIGRQEKQARGNSTNATSAQSKQAVRDDTGKVTRVSAAFKTSRRDGHKRPKSKATAKRAIRDYQTQDAVSNDECEMKRYQQGQRDSARNRQSRAKSMKPPHHRKEQHRDRSVGARSDLLYDN